MADVQAIADGLATRLATIAGMRTSSHVADAVSVPHASIALESIEFDRAMGRGLDELTFTVRVYTSRASDRAGQKALYGYLVGSGAKSVKAAIEGDRTLGGAASDCRVSDVQNVGVYEAGGTDYFGADFTVTVYATGA